MKRFLTRFLVILVLLVIGCQQQTESNNASIFEIKVSNNSANKIYPALSSEGSNQRFGVVSIGKSKTVGFSPFKVGENISIRWTEGDNEQEYQDTFNTAPLTSIESSIHTLNVVYNGQNEWTIRALNKNGDVLGSVP